PAYDEHPYLSDEAARWLVDRGVRMLGVDTPTPDLPVAGRPPGFDWPVHRILLSNHVLVVEHLCNLEPLEGQRVDLMVMALNVRGADGAPARIVGRRSRGSDAGN